VVVQVRPAAVDDARRSLQQGRLEDLPGAAPLDSATGSCQASTSGCDSCRTGRRRRRSWTPDPGFGKLGALGTNAAEAGLSVAARVDGDHFELPADAVELLRQVRPADRQWFIEEVTGALAVATKTKNFWLLQDVLEAWTVTVRLQQHPASAAMIERMQRRERGLPVDLDELRRPRG
jgi:uncharacterized protein DUF6247